MEMLELVNEYKYLECVTDKGECRKEDENSDIRRKSGRGYESHHHYHHPSPFCLTIG